MCFSLLESLYFVDISSTLFSLFVLVLKIFITFCSSFIFQFEGVSNFFVAQLLMIETTELTTRKKIWNNLLKIVFQQIVENLIKFFIYTVLLKTHSTVCSLHKKKMVADRYLILVFFILDLSFLDPKSLIVFLHVCFSLIFFFFSRVLAFVFSNI